MRNINPKSSSTLFPTLKNKINYAKSYAKSIDDFIKTVTETSNHHENQKLHKYN